MWQLAAATHTNLASVSLFPKDPTLHKKWTDQDKRTRSLWEGPSIHSVLCSVHFEEECFEPQGKLADSLGLDGRRKHRLKADVVPTLSERPLSKW